MSSSAVNGVYTREILNAVREGFRTEKGETVNRTFAVLSPEKIVTKVDEQSVGVELFTPKLVHPAKGELTHLGKLIETIGYLSNLYQNIGRSDFEQRLNVIKIEQKMREASVNSVQQKIDDQISLYQGVLEQLESLLSECDNVLVNIGLFEAELSEVYQRLKNLSPEDPDYPAFVAREADLVMLSEQAKKNIEYLQARIAITSGAATGYATEIDELLMRVETLSSRPLQNSQYMASVKKSAENTKLLVYLMSLIQDILQKSCEYDIKNNNELNNKIIKQHQIRMEERAREYEKQLASAEKVSKGFRLLLKIFGIAITILTAITAGPVVLSISVVVALVLLVDVICDFSIDYSFIDKGVEAVMEVTFKPLAEKIRLGMIKGGYSESDSELVSQIVSMILFTAVVLLGGWAVTRCLSALSTQSAIVSGNIALVIKKITWGAGILEMVGILGSGVTTVLFTREAGYLLAQIQQQQLTLEYSIKMLNDAAVSRLKTSNDIIVNIQKTLISMLERSKKTANQIFYNTALKA
ncbi:TPA: type III secretion system translocon subunit SctE [Salmonella enterica]|nr:hypothetical protein [Salmonella enterica subsp. diarizonae]HEA0263516.1 type III secretion system translocon subunit SctE [Salmonella enterica]HEA0268611.1 type III secretion system translocon subunit SctE [Salmonella enterica]HEA0295548.1 type III secretion system translocon subunit SctE [Salmonella enterica]HEA0304657.1 type III secretion system translocon subunit SctE [Salmonella enterica]